MSGEVAAAVMLLCGAGLLLQTLLTLVGGDPGYRSASESVLTLDFSVPTGRPRATPPPKRWTSSTRGDARRHRAARRAPRRLGVQPALRHQRARAMVVDIAGDPLVETRDRPTAEFTAADPGYFATLDLPIVKGRGFTDARHVERPRCASSTRRSYAGTSPAATRLARGWSLSGGGPAVRTSARLSASRGRPAANPMRRRRCCRSTCPWRSIRPGMSTWWCSRRRAPRSR